MSKKYHPDLSRGDEKNSEYFKKIIKAYEILGNVEKKRKYDDFLAGKSLNSDQKKERKNVEEGEEI